MGIYDVTGRRVTLLNPRDKNFIQDLIDNAATYKTGITTVHPLYAMNALERAHLANITGESTGEDTYECLARLRLNLINPLERAILETMIASDTPASILGSSLVAWFDASDADTTFQDSGATTPATANNDPVGAWQDKSGNGYHATQATTANKPRIKTATLNGLTVVNFDGSDILVTGNVPISTFVIWAVFRASSTGVRLVYEHSTNTGSIGDGAYLNTDVNYTIQVSRSTVNSAWDLSAGWGAGNTWRIVRHEQNGTHLSHKLAINSVDQSLTNTLENNDIGIGTATQPFHIGGRASTFRITGDIAEIVIASPYVTAQQIADMDAYINNKWAVY